jgi:hypothetical protein
VLREEVDGLEEYVRWRAFRTAQPKRKLTRHDLQVTSELIHAAEYLRGTS